MSTNHSEFIRNHPKLSIDDLILEASKVGLDIKKSLIYNVRSRDRNGDSKAKGTKAKGTKAKGTKAKGTKAKGSRSRAVAPTSGIVTRQPVAIVFFDSEALVRGIKEGFPQPML